MDIINNVETLNNHEVYTKDQRKA